MSHEDVRCEQGYSLIELLVVVLVLGILAAIAIPAVRSQRQAAWRSAVESDVRNAGSAVSFAMMGSTLAPDGIQLGPAELSPSTATNPVWITAVTDGVLLAFAGADDSDDFCLAGAHTRLSEAPVAVFDSTRQRLTETCSFDAGFGSYLGPALNTPVTFAARFRDDSGYISGQTEDGGFTTGTYGRELLVDAQDLRTGSFELFGAQASYQYSGGGWAVVVHGEGEGGSFNGYTVQLDRGYGGGEFILREWQNGSERSPVLRVPPPAGFDFAAAHDLRVDVDGPSVRLLVDGVEVLHYDEMSRDRGAMGVRSWSGTSVTVDRSQLTIDPS